VYTLLYSSASQLTMTDTDSYAANGQGLSINGYDASLDVSDSTNYLANGHDTNGDTNQRDNVIVVSTPTSSTSTIVLVRSEQ
jgi:hypothetical protein